MKLLIAVIASEEPLYQRLIDEGLKKTWAANEDDDVEVVYYYGGRPSTVVEGDSVFLSVPEGVENIGRKTIEFFKYALANKTCNYLFRTNCSSYVDVVNLKNFLEDKPREDFFSSSVATFAGRPFASGSGYVLSHDLVEKVVANERLWDHRLLDDVALSFLLQDLGVALRPSTRQDVSSVDDVDKLDTSQYHFRCKSFGLGGRRTDCQVMHYIHLEMTMAHKASKKKLAP